MPTELSQEQHEILKLIVQGYSNAGIARRTNLAVRSIDSYMTRIREKLELKPNPDMNARVQLVNAARELYRDPLHC